MLRRKRRYLQCTCLGYFIHARKGVTVREPRKVAMMIQVDLEFDLVLPS